MGQYDKKADLLSQTKENTLDIDAFYDMVYADLPDVNITTKELTAMIRKVVPDYNFEEGTAADRQEREKLRDDARKAIAETSVKKRYAGKNEKWNELAGGRNIGSALNTYREKRMSRQGHLDIDSENFPKYFPAKKEIYAHLVGNVQNLIDTYNNMTDQELVKSTDELFALFNLCDTENSVKKETRWSEEEREKIIAALNPLSTMCNTMIAKLNLLASPIGAMVDPDPLVKLSITQTTALDQATAHIYDIGDEEADRQARSAHGQFGPSGVGLGTAALYKEMTDKYKKSVGLSLLEKDFKLGIKCFDLTGAPVADATHTCLHDGMPVIFASEEYPETEPVLGFIHDGKTYVGEEALQVYKEFGNAQIPEPEAPVYDPNPFKWLWDKIVEIFGFTSDRMLHEQAKADHNTLVGPIRAKNDILRYITDDPENLEYALNERKNIIQGRLIQDKAAKEYNKNYKSSAEVEASKGKEKVEEQPQIINEQPQTEEKKNELIEKEPKVESVEEKPKVEEEQQPQINNEQPPKPDEEQIIDPSDEALIDEALNEIEQEERKELPQTEEKKNELIEEEPQNKKNEQAGFEEVFDSKELQSLEEDQNILLGNHRKSNLLGEEDEEDLVGSPDKGRTFKNLFDEYETENEPQLTGTEKAKAGTQRLYDKQLGAFYDKLKALGKDYEEFRQEATRIAEDDYINHMGLLSDTGKLLTGLSGDMLKSLGNLYNQNENLSLEEMLDITLGNHTNSTLHQSNPMLQKSGSKQMGGLGNY